MLAILATLLPDFALIGFGGALSRRLSAEIWRGIDKLNFDLLLPALLFLATARQPVSMADVTGVGIAVWAMMGAALLIAAPLRPKGGPEARLAFAGAWQTVWRFNSALAFIVVAGFPERVQALMGVAIGTGVPMANLLAVTVLSRGGGLGLAATAAKVALNPFLLASAGGLLVGVSGLALPGMMVQLLERLAAAAIPVALLSMGATLDWRSLHRPPRVGAALIGIKLLVMPLLVLAGGWLLGLEPALHAVVLLMAALPTAPSAHILAAAFGADPRPCATIIAQGTVAAALTLPVWMMLAHRIAGG